MTSLRTNTAFSEALHQGLHSLRLRKPFIKPEDIQVTAWRVLTQIKPPAEMLLARLESQMKSDESLEQNVATWVLGCAGEGAERCVPYLVTALKSTNQVQRFIALQSLSHLGARAAAALPDLILALDDKALAPGAIRALGMMGSNAAPAIPKLVQQLETTNKTLQVTAAQSLYQIDPGQSRALEIWLGALRDPDVQVRGQAIDACGNIQSPSQLFIPGLLENVADTNLWIQAVWTLKKLAPENRDAVPILIEKLKDSRNLTDFNAACYLVRIDPAQPEGLQKLLEVFTNPALGHLRVITIETLREAGCDSPEVISALKAATHESDKNTRQAATAALRRIERKKEAKTDGAIGR